MTPIEAEVQAILHNIMARVRLAYPIKKKEVAYSLDNPKVVKFLRDILPLKNKYSIK